jgi:hypothetical protein
LKRLLKRQQTTSKQLANGIALDDRDGKPRDPELETEVIEVAPKLEAGDTIDLPAGGVGVVVDPVPVEVIEKKLKTTEPREELNRRIEALWYDFHEKKLDTGLLEMDRELGDYCDPGMSSDAEAWRFADKLKRTILLETRM